MWVSHHSEQDGSRQIPGGGRDGGGWGKGPPENSHRYWSGCIQTSSAEALLTLNSEWREVCGIVRASTSLTLVRLVYELCFSLGLHDGNTVHGHIAIWHLKLKMTLADTCRMNCVSKMLCKFKKTQAHWWKTQMQKPQHSGSEHQRMRTMKRTGQ